MSYCGMAVSRLTGRETPNRPHRADGERACRPHLSARTFGVPYSASSVVRAIAFKNRGGPPFLGSLECRADFALGLAA